MSMMEMKGHWLSEKSMHMLGTILGVILLTVVLSATNITDAFASNGKISNDALETMICNAINYITGTTGKGVAAVVIIVTGVGFFSGNINWVTLLGIMAGIGVIFGAPTVINKLTGSTTTFCANTIQTVPQGTGTITTP